MGLGGKTPSQKRQVKNAKSKTLDNNAAPGKETKQGQITGVTNETEPSKPNALKGTIQTEKPVEYEQNIRLQFEISTEFNELNSTSVLMMRIAPAMRYTWQIAISPWQTQ